MVDIRPLDVITDSPWFSGMPTQALEGLVAYAGIRPFPRGTFLFTEGENDSDVYCVVTGRIRIAISSTAGHDFAIIDLTHGAWFGEQGLVSDRGRVASAEAMVHSDVLVLPKQALIELGDSYPELYRNILRHNVEGTRNLYDLLGGTLFYPLRARVAGRVLAMLEDHGVERDGALLLDLKLTQNDFARLARGSRQRVNSIFRDWSERGIAETRGERLAILDLAALQEEVSLE